MLADDADPADVADAVVDDLNASATALADEAALVAQVRDFAPGLFRDLLETHAARRLHPARLESLAVAALTDRDATSWLSGAQSASSMPAGKPVGVSAPGGAVGRSGRAPST
jgi:hypothetical protein